MPAASAASSTVGVDPRASRVRVALTRASCVRVFCPTLPVRTYETDMIIMILWSHDSFRSVARMWLRRGRGDLVQRRPRQGEVARGLERWRVLARRGGDAAGTRDGTPPRSESRDVSHPRGRA